ncbi:MAG: hypothetical protein Unbinned1322contig1000_6 [Prokaryotic dsDNA virus sp.]|nr:MAG: hypothetical protein Unbinned1322contig1000_6 [Prokaryotic dsDNA virus sp.]|tara:strand:+ start:1704 stop:1967 length:264 start_codon:yes stop_codon:yes gene_type:complete
MKEYTEKEKECARLIAKVVELQQEQGNRYTPTLLNLYKIMEITNDWSICFTLHYLIIAQSMGLVELIPDEQGMIKVYFEDKYKQEDE